MLLDSKFPLRVTALVLLCLCPAAASSDVDSLPHYASVRREQAYLREGPSYANRILWIYRHKNYPVKIIGSYDAWRHVRDSEGATGWMHHTQLSDRRSILFIGAVKTTLHRDDDPRSKVVAYAAPGVVAWLKACEPSVCEVEASGIDGWVDRRNIWGVEAGEVFQ